MVQEQTQSTLVFIQQAGSATSVLRILEELHVSQ